LAAVKRIGQVSIELRNVDRGFRKFHGTITFRKIEQQWLPETMLARRG